MTLRKPVQTPHSLRLLALSLVMAFVPIVASAASGLCERLFSQKSPALNATESAAKTASPEALNDASREFVARLQYLLNERRLLVPEDLAVLITSPVPVNPLGNRVTKMVLLPHHAAFADLLKTDLQWTAIQQAVRALFGSAEQEQKREEVATEETQRVPLPLEFKKFPFELQHVFQTSDGRTLAISVQNNWKQGSESTRIQVVDALSGVQLSEIPIQAGIVANTLEFAEANGAVLMLVPNPKTRELLVFNLLSKDLISHPVVGPSAAEVQSKRSSMPATAFIKVSGAIRLIAVYETTAYLLDPLTGKETDKFVLNEAADYFATSLVSFGDRISIAGPRSKNHLIDLTRKRPEIEDETVFIYDHFTFQGHDYALAYDMSKGYTEGKSWLRTINTDTLKHSRSLSLAQDTQDPWILGTYEDGQTVIGLLATDRDLFQVDLIKGKVLKKLSQTPTGARGVHFKSNTAPEHRLMFNYRGKPYVVALMDGNNDEWPKIFVLDAVTFEGFKLGLELTNRHVEYMQLLPEAKDGVPRALITFNDHTSSVVTLFNPLQ